MLTNIVFTESNEPDLSLVSYTLSNIVFVGSITSAKIQVVAFGTGIPIVGASVTVAVGESIYTSQVTDSQGRTTYDYQIGVECKLVVEHPDYETNQAVFTETTFTQFNERVRLVPKRKVFITSDDIAINPKPNDPTNRFLV